MSPPPLPIALCTFIIACTDSSVVLNPQSSTLNFRLQSVWQQSHATLRGASPLTIYKEASLYFASVTGGKGGGGIMAFFCQQPVNGDGLECWPGCAEHDQTGYFSYYYYSFLEILDQRRDAAIT